MAYAVLRLVSYALCFNFVLIAFADNGLFADWRHLSSGLAEFRGSANGDWTKDGSPLLETNYKILADGDYDVVASEATSDSKLENSEETKSTKDDKEFKSNRKVLQHIIPVVEKSLPVLGTIDLRSQKPDRAPMLKDSSHNGKDKVNSEYGILTILLPFRLEKYAEENGISNHDNSGGAVTLHDDQSVVARSLELQKQKFRSFRRKRDTSSDEIGTVEERLLFAGAEEEDEDSFSDECERCSIPAKKEKRDTGSISVETTTPSPKDNITHNLNETSERSENNTDDSNKMPISRLLDMQITTSLPPSTTSKQGVRESEYRHEEPKGAAQMTVKYLDITTEKTDGLLEVEDDFAYITDPQEIHLGPDRDTASGELVSAPGKIITLHWTIKLDPKDNSSASGEHPHPPADEGRDVFEQTVYLHPNGSHGDGHTANIPEHTGSGGDISEYLDQLPLPSGAAQVFPYIQSAGPPAIGQDEMSDKFIAPVLEQLSQQPISAPLDDWLEPQDELVYPLDQSEVVLPENVLMDGPDDMESSLPVSLVEVSADEQFDHDTTLYTPELVDEVADMETAGEDFDPDTLPDIPSLLDEPVEVELEGENFDANTLPYKPSLMQEPVSMEGEHLDPNTLSSIPSLVGEADDVDPGLPALLVDESSEQFDPDTLSYVTSSLDEPVDVELESEHLDPDTLPYIPSLLDEPVEVELEGENFDANTLPYKPPLMQEPVSMEGEHLDPNTLSSIPSLVGEADEVDPGLPALLVDESSEQFDPDTLSYVASSLDEPVDMELEGEHLDSDALSYILSLLDKPVGIVEPVDMEFEDEHLDSDTLSSLDEPIDMEPSVPVSTIGVIESGLGQFDPATMALEPLPVYEEHGVEPYDQEDHDEYGLEAYDQEVHDEYGQEDHDHHIDNPQGSLCQCDEVVARVFNDRP